MINHANNNLIIFNLQKTHLTLFNCPPKVLLVTHFVLNSKAQEAKQIPVKDFVY